MMAFSLFSCESYLDINENPNQATSSSAQQVLPNALTSTAATIVSYHDYGAQVAGYQANAYGWGGQGPELTYNYTTTNWTTLWSRAYDNLTDYDYIERTTKADEAMAYYNAIAKIMKAHNFQLLVDQYGDIPYKEALNGGDNITPAYEKAENIYQDLVVQLDSAVYIINNSENANAVASGDVMFKGDMDQWIAFANTLKLRMLLRMSGVAELSSFVNERFATFGSNPAFLTQDAIVQPGYTTSGNKKNPMWMMYHTDAAGSAAQNGRARIATDFILDFYNGRISDTFRGTVTYNSFPNTASNQLGVTGEDIDEAPSGSVWYTSANEAGILKSATMGQPILLASESYFLQAEAFLKGYLAGNAEAAYEEGVEESFTYLYKNAAGTVIASLNPAADAAKYFAANEGSRLVDFEAAGTETEKLEAIITQKYIALNFIHGHEAWSEFRRTGYPTITSSSTFASTQSTSTRPDRLPVRLLYPNTEYQYNQNNVPSGGSVNQFTTNIFWDLD